MICDSTKPLLNFRLLNGEHSNVWEQAIFCFDLTQSHLKEGYSFEDGYDLQKGNYIED